MNIHEPLWRHKALIKYAQLLFMTYEEFFIDSFWVDLFFYWQAINYDSTILFVEKIVILFSIQTFGLPN